ncbi:MAG: carbon-nitrogen hydrolase family protein [Sphingomonadales bacterium]|nr:carbon-nitrogen hydrolase family protein [Sphingomonadales bacterium]
MSAFIVAAAQYPIDRFDDWRAYEAKLTDWIERAVDGGARLAVFPEYGGMELASLDAASMGDLGASMRALGALVPRIDALHSALSAQFGVHILAASLPVRRDNGAFVNRARLFAPGGKIGVQDKLIMTRFEREEWGISAGGPLRLFNTELGKIGITICYDCEFPLLSRALVEAGAEVVLVPSCTDTAHGYWRVRHGAQARALEGQCYAVQSPTVGTATWSPAVDINVGAAAVYGPPDGNFPSDGVVSIGNLDSVEWVFGEVNPARVHALRANGGVLNTLHWAEQPGAVTLPAVELVDLR